VLIGVLSAAFVSKLGLQAEMEQQVLECEESVAKCAAESEEAERSITELDAQRTGLLAGDLKAMEEEANDLSKAVVKATEKWKSKKSDLAAEIKSRKVCF